MAFGDATSRPVAYSPLANKAVTLSKATILNGDQVAHVRRIKSVGMLFAWRFWINGHNPIRRLNRPPNQAPTASKWMVSNATAELGRGFIVTAWLVNDCEIIKAIVSIPPNASSHNTFF